MEGFGLGIHSYWRSAMKWAQMRAGLWKLSSQCFDFFIEMRSKDMLEVGGKR